MEKMPFQLLAVAFDAAAKGGERRILAEGPPGTGKTTFGSKWAKQRDYICFSLTCSEETSGQDIIGKYVLKGSEFVWADSPGMTAWRQSLKPDVKGIVVILNEVDKLGADALTQCYGLLDDPEIACMTLPTNETIRPNQNKIIYFATTNGSRDHLPEGLKSRFAIRVVVNRVNPEIANSVAADLRNLILNCYGPGVSDSLDPRSIMAFDKLRKAGVDPKTASELAFEKRGREVLNAIKVAGLPK